MRRSAHTYLNDVVTEGVANQLHRIGNDGIQQLIVIILRSRVQTALDHATAMAMSGDLQVNRGPYTYLEAGFDNLLKHHRAVFLRHVLETTLNHMIAVGMGAQVRNVRLEHIHNVLHHIRLLTHLNKLLDTTSTMDIVGSCNQVRLDMLQLHIIPTLDRLPHYDAVQGYSHPTVSGKGSCRRSPSSNP